MSCGLRVPLWQPPRPLGRAAGPRAARRGLCFAVMLVRAWRRPRGTGRVLAHGGLGRGVREEREEGKVRKGERARK